MSALRDQIAHLPNGQRLAIEMVSFALHGSATAADRTLHPGGRLWDRVLYIRRKDSGPIFVEEENP